MLTYDLAAWTKLPRALDYWLCTAFDDVAVREDCPIEIPRHNPLKECGALAEPATQQQHEGTRYRGAAERTVEPQQKSRIWGNHGARC
jgi:hypothetical protein